MLVSIAEVKQYKETLYAQQNGTCPLCNHKLGSVNESHLDHSHDLTGNNAGKCRGLLHAQCNLLEGMIRHKFSRSRLTAKIELGVFLKNLTGYLLNDYGDKPYHPKFITDSVRKFSKSTRKDQKSILERLDALAGASKEEDIKIYRKTIKVLYAQ